MFLTEINMEHYNNEWQTTENKSADGGLIPTSVEAYSRYAGIACEPPTKRKELEDETLKEAEEKQLSHENSTKCYG